MVQGHPHVARGDTLQSSQEPEPTRSKPAQSSVLGKGVLPWLAVLVQKEMSCLALAAGSTGKQNLTRLTLLGRACLSTHFTDTLSQMKTTSLLNPQPWRMHN